MLGVVALSDSMSLLFLALARRSYVIWMFKIREWLTEFTKLVTEFTNSALASVFGLFIWNILFIFVSRKFRKRWAVAVAEVEVEAEALILIPRPPLRWSKLRLLSRLLKQEPK